MQRMVPWLTLILVGAVATAQEPRRPGAEAPAPRAAAEPPRAAAEPPRAEAPAPAEPAPRKPDKRENLGLLLVLAPLLLAAAMTIRCGLSLGVAALLPEFTARGAAAVLARPWLCCGWGAFLALLLLTLLHAFGQAGPPGQLPALLIAGLGLLLIAVGSTAVCEALGERVAALAPQYQPGRLAKLVIGSLVLVPLLAAPPGWPLIPFLGAASLGACRLALAHRLPGPAPASDPA